MVSVNCGPHPCGVVEEVAVKLELRPDKFSMILNYEIKIDRPIVD